MPPAPMTPHTRNLIAMLVLVLATAALAGCGASARTWAAADCWKSTEQGGDQFQPFPLKSCHTLTVAPCIS